MRPGSGFWLFGASLLLILILRLLIGLVPVPNAQLNLANIAVSVLFVAIPIYGMFAAARDAGRLQGPNRWYVAGGLIVGGLALQFLLGMLLPGLDTKIFLKAVVIGLSQTGLLLWCFGVGVALASSLRDKNMVLPIAVFLAIFDIWLVFSPMGTVNQVLAEGGQRLADLAYQVPAPTSRPTTGLAEPLAYVGPADYLFLAMFFTVLFRFAMRTRAALWGMTLVLPIYLFYVLATGNAMPALVPIGAVILVTNWREFRLARDEKIVTWAILLFGLAFLYYSIVIYKAPVHEVKPPAPSSPMIQA